MCACGQVLLVRNAGIRCANLVGLFLHRYFKSERYTSYWIVDIETTEPKVI
jgi:hypothetical protein